MKTFLSPAFLLSLISLLFLQAAPLAAQTNTAPKVRKIPFHGTIVALDRNAQTITLNGQSARVLHVTPTTKITDGSGNPTTFATATVGEDVGGSYVKSDMTLYSLRLGAKTGEAATTTSAPAPAATPTPAPPPATTTAATPAATAPAAKVKKTPFTGKVTAVDAAASTFTIKSRTFTVTSASVVTDSTGAASSLANLAVGTKVSGSAEKSADGSTLTVDSLKISK